MKLISGPTDENSLTLSGDFQVATVEEDGTLLERKGRVEIVLQVTEQGEHTGHWLHMLWEYTYSSDVVPVPFMKRRGHVRFARDIEHPARLKLNKHGIGTGPMTETRDALFFEGEFNKPCRA